MQTAIEMAVRQRTESGAGQAAEKRKSPDKSSKPENQISKLDNRIPQ